MNDYDSEVLDKMSDGDDEQNGLPDIMPPPLAKQPLTNVHQAFTDSQGSYHPQLTVDTLGDAQGNPFERTVNNTAPMETIDDKLAKAGAATQGFKSPFEFKVALIKGLREVAQERGMDLESPEGKQWYAANLNHGVKNEMGTYLAMPEDPKQWVKVGDSMFNTKTKEFANPPSDLAGLFQQHADVHGSLADMAQNNADLKENGIKPISITAPSLAMNQASQTNASDSGVQPPPQPLPVKQPVVATQEDQTKDDPMAAIEALDPATRDSILNKHKTLADEYKAYQKDKEESVGDATPESIEMAARTKILTGASGITGMGKEAVKLNKSINNRVAQIAKEEGITPEQMALNAARYKGGSAEVKKLMTMRGPQMAMSAKADQAIDLAGKMSNKVDRSGVPLWNQFKQATQQQIAGDPDLSAFNAAITTAVNEYARATSGTGQVSDAARKHAYDLLNSAQSQKQFDAIVNTLHKEVKIASGSFEGAISNAEKGINSGTVNIPHPDDSKAIVWARKNSNNPKAQKILKLHGL